MSSVLTCVGAAFPSAQPEKPSKAEVLFAVSAASVVVGWNTNPPELPPLEPDAEPLPLDDAALVELPELEPLAELEPLEPVAPLLAELDPLELPLLPEARPEELVPVVTTPPHPASNAARKIAFRTHDPSVTNLTARAPQLRANAGEDALSRRRRMQLRSEHPTGRGT